MNKLRCENDNIPLLSLSNNQTQKNKRFTKRQSRTRYSNARENAAREAIMYNTSSTSMDDSEYKYTENINGRSHPKTGKKMKNDFEHKNVSYSTFSTSTYSNYVTDDDDEEEPWTCAAELNVSFFHVVMNKLMPTLFPMPSPIRCRIKSAQTMSRVPGKHSGSILVPTGPSSMFPDGIILETEAGHNVTEICFPASGQTFKLK